MKLQHNSEDDDIPLRAGLNFVNGGGRAESEGSENTAGASSLKWNPRCLECIIMCKHNFFAKLGLSCSIGVMEIVARLEIHSQSHLVYMKASFFSVLRLV